MMHDRHLDQDMVALSERAERAEHERDQLLAGIAEATERLGLGPGGLSELHAALDSIETITTDLIEETEDVSEYQGIVGVVARLQKSRTILYRMRVLSGLQGALQDVAEFHAGFAGHPRTVQLPDATDEQPASLTRAAFRYAIMEEEWRELTRAMMARSVVDTVDGLLDLAYTSIGSLLAFIGPKRAAAAWAEVHRSNMTKLVGGPVFDERGKLAKPEGYEPPDIAWAIAPIAPCYACRGSNVVAGQGEYEIETCPECK